MAPNAGAAVKKLVETYLDKDCYRVIEGDHTVAAAIT